jgi:hypothetical protein
MGAIVEAENFVFRPFFWMKTVTMVFGELEDQAIVA